ncbi:MAG: GPH family glycoside/pentoside/hexuronide:cation symporter, partial [Candidatus Azotimanducaceae bacterium]
MSTRRLSMPTMLAFGIGQAAEGIKNQAFNVFLLFYYQQVIGIPGTLAGLALGIALFFDAISDPAAGVISDRFKSKWGRRHPFMLFSAVPLVITFIALFNPPDGLSEFFNFVWLTVFAVLVRASLTFYYVPHLALGADMAHDYHQRSTLYAMSTVFSITAMAVVSFVGYRFFFPTTELFNPGTLNPAAYSDFSITFAAVMFVVIIISCLGTAREIPHLHNSPPKRTATIRNILRDYK